MGGQTTQNTTQTAEPPAWAKPHLENIASQAQSLYNSGKGFDYYPGSTVTPMSSQSQAGLQGMEAYASQPNSLLGNMSGFTSGVLAGQGNNPTTSAALGAYTRMAQGDPSLQAYARGDYLDGGSPAFQQALDYQSGKIGNQVNQLSAGMGRYGSAAHAKGVVDSVGNFRNNAMQQELAREQGLQMQAQGQLAQQQGAGAAGILGSQFQAAGMAPQVYQAGMLPFQTMGQVGSAYEDKSNQYLRDAIARFQSNQQQPFQQLAAYQGAINGLNPAAFASKQGTTTTNTGFNPLSLLPMAMMAF